MAIYASTDSDVTGIEVKRGQATGIAIDSTGVKTFAISFTSATGYVSGGTDFTNALDSIELTLANPTATDAVIGAPYYTSSSKSGFTINVPITTASTTSGATVSVDWKAYGY